MGSVTNLRTARKQKARDAARRDAAARTARAGAGAADAERLRREAERAARALDGHRRDPDDGRG